MKQNLRIDLHSHSGYSGGVGTINLDSLLMNLKFKGIDIFGSGDILHEKWRALIQDSCKEVHQGLYRYKNFEPLLMLQTEIILSSPYKYDSKRRKTVHAVLLFPSFDLIEKVLLLLPKWKVKNTIGRPFLICKSIEELSEKLSILYSLTDFNSAGLVLIPAHIFTPDGIFGGKNIVFSLADFFGSFSTNIRVVETGLSADPKICMKLPELSDKTFISNSDAHSEALNRIGREFTSIAVDDMSYNSIIQSLYKKQINYTVEFHPEHGRYYLTGHRNDKHANNASIVMPSKKVPKDFICPICLKPLTLGVEFISDYIAKKQSHSLVNKQKQAIVQPFYHRIPLLDIIIAAHSHCNYRKKSIRDYYYKIINVFGNEGNVFELSTNNLIDQLNKIDIPHPLYKAIIDVKEANFSYKSGYDGRYGELVLQ